MGNFENDISFNLRLEKLLEDFSLTMYWLAKHSGYSYTAINKMNSKQQGKPHFDTLVKIIETFEKYLAQGHNLRLNLRWFVTGEEETPYVPIGGSSKTPETSTYQDEKLESSNKVVALNEDAEYYQERKEYLDSIRNDFENRLDDKEKVIEALQNENQSLKMVIELLKDKQG